MPVATADCIATTKILSCVAECEKYWHLKYLKTLADKKTSFEKLNQEYLKGYLFFVFDVLVFDTLTSLTGSLFCSVGVRYMLISHIRLYE